MSDTPKELQSAYQRWEMQSFDTRASVAAPPAAAAIPSAAALAAIGEQARQAGHQAGLADGHAEGYAAGQAEGYAAGHSAGYADASALGRDETAQALGHLQAMALEFGQALAAADDTIAADVLDLALHLARSMLRGALEIKPELVLAVVREAIGYLPALQQPALLMLHPADALLVRAGIGEELDKGGWRVLDDATIARGGCQIDTASNQIDAQTATRWNRLTSALGNNLDWLGP